MTAFSARRFDRCEFVQDASRRVGEAGAVEDLAATAPKRTHAGGAQRDVDTFYARIAGADLMAVSALKLLSEVVSERARRMNAFRHPREILK